MFFGRRGEKIVQLAGTTKIKIRVLMPSKIRHTTATGRFSPLVNNDFLIEMKLSEASTVVKNAECYKKKVVNLRGSVQ